MRLALRPIVLDGMVPGAAGGGGGGGGGGGSGWNPADATLPQQYLYTSSSKIATRNLTNANAGVRGLTSKTSGLLYFEVYCVLGNLLCNTYIGIADAAFPLAGPPYPVPGGTKFLVYYNVGQILTDAGVGASITSYNTADTVGLEVNFTTSQVRVFKNNVLQTTAAFGSGTAMFPYFLTHTASSAGLGFHLRTSAADQVYPTRSGGYVAWD